MIKILDFGWNDRFGEGISCEYEYAREEGIGFGAGNASGKTGGPQEYIFRFEEKDDEEYGFGYINGGGDMHGNGFDSSYRPLSFIMK